MNKLGMNLRRGRAAACATIVAAAFLASAGAAWADTEPNNVISQAEGPVGGGAPVSGTVGTPDDVDWYVFYAASQQQLHFTSAVPAGNDADCIVAGVYDINGSGVSADYTTPPGVNRYFVKVKGGGYNSCPASQPYSFQLDPGASVVGGAAMDRALSPTSEPNESMAQAQGPLAPNVNYTGATETSNDKDWFYFYVPAGAHQLDLSVTAPVIGGCDAYIYLYEAGDDEDSRYDAEYASAYWTGFGHIKQTVTGPAQYFISASSSFSRCGSSAAWQFRIETPDAVTSSPPPPPAPAVPTPTPVPPVAKAPSKAVSKRCKEAKTSNKRWTKKVSTTKKQLSPAHRSSTRRKLSRRLAAERRTLKRVRDRVAIYC